MYLQIPVKLERYIEQIKRQTNRFIDEKKLTLLQIGKSKNGDTYKIMMLLYNPYNNPIHITPNLFSSNDAIYKMYPNEFKIGADTVSAFVLFTSKDSKIKINELELLTSIKSDIETILEKYNKDDAEQIEVHHYFQVNPTDFESDKTIALSNLKIEPNGLETISYTNEHDDELVVKFSEIIEKDNTCAIELDISNSNDKQNIKIKGMNLKLSDGEHKMHISSDEQLVIKAQSSKRIRVYVNKIEFSLIKREQMQMKATIL